MNWEIGIVLRCWENKAFGTALNFPGHVLNMRQLQVPAVLVMFMSEMLKLQLSALPLQSLVPPSAPVFLDWKHQRLDCMELCFILYKSDVHRLGLTVPTWAKKQSKSFTHPSRWKAKFTWKVSGSWISHLLPLSATFFFGKDGPTSTKKIR